MMTSVKINKDQPAAIQQMTSKANEAVTVNDSAGRTLTIKRPDFLAQFRLTKALGPVADNLAYQSMVFPVLYLTAIDGVDIFPPKSDMEVEAILSKLDAHGYQALTEAIQNHFKDIAIDERETVKNS